MVAILHSIRVNRYTSLWEPSVMKIVLSPRVWIVAVAAVVSLGSTVGTQSSYVTPSHRLVVSDAPRKVLAEDPVSGEPVARQLATRPLLAVIIENFPDARPQWGLSLASRVYEVITEGGITRYLVVFGPNYDADRIGPVRSVRTQFLDYVMELDAPVAHVGGNSDALDLIRTLHIKDLDEFRYARAYRRILRPRLALEHTMYTSIHSLRAVAGGQRGLSEDAGTGSPAWKDDAPYEFRPASQEVTIDFSFPEYRVSWRYRREGDDYQRILAGTPDVDAATGVPVTARSIAIAVVPRVHGKTRIGEDTWTFSTIGSGRAWIIQDGAMTPGQWQKRSRTDRLRFVDGTGREIRLNRGRQWVEIIPPEVTPAFGPAVAAQ
jgi:hypothetical protein